MFALWSKDCLMGAFSAMGNYIGKAYCYWKGIDIYSSKE